MAVSKAQMRASKNYIKKHDRVEFLLPKGGKQNLKEHCAILGISVNQFCANTLKKQIISDRQSMKKSKKMIQPQRKN